MKSRRLERAIRIIDAWDPPVGVSALVSVEFRGRGTHLVALMRTCCATVSAGMEMRRRLGGHDCHAAWDALAEHVMDRCDCPHDTTPDGPLPTIERALAASRRAFLDSTRERLPVPDGWDVWAFDFDELDLQED